MTDVLSALQDDFKLFLQALWAQLDLPEPTRAQYAIADDLQSVSYRERKRKKNREVEREGGGGGRKKTNKKKKDGVKRGRERTDTGYTNDT